MPMARARSVVVVGGGVIGLCAAHYAAERGHRVRVIDRGGPEDENCSFGNAGLIVPSHFVPLAAPGMVALGLKWMWKPRSPFHVKPRLSLDLARWGWSFCRAARPARAARAAPLLRDLSLASRAAYEALAAAPGMDFGLEKRGLLALTRSRAALEEEAKTAREARALGLEAEVLSAEETARLEPGIRMDIAGAVYFPQDCHVVPARVMGGLRRLLERAGVEISWSTEAVGWRVSGKRIDAVQTPRGEVAGDEFVICCGSWSKALARGLRVRLPLEAGKGYSLTLPRPRRLPAIPSLLIEARVAVTPMAGSLRFGGTMEMSGLDESISAPRVEAIVDAAIRYFPELNREDFQGVAPWRGLRPCSPDGLPYVGRTRAYQNLLVATGHAMLGLSLGPITGKLVAEIISGERPSLDIQLLNPDRYT